MGFQYGTERAWFLFNRIYDNEEGILIASDGGPGGDGGPSGRADDDANSWLACRRRTRGPRDQVAVGQRQPARRRCLPIQDLGLQGRELWTIVSACAMTCCAGQAILVGG